MNVVTIFPNTLCCLQQSTKERNNLFITSRDLSVRKGVLQNVPHCSVSQDIVSDDYQYQNAYKKPDVLTTTL